MAEQLAFDLPVRAALGRGDFFVAAPNALALATVDAGDWPGGKLLLTGPEGAGKSHLARVWADDTGALILDAGALPDGPWDATHLVVEDADRIAGNGAAEAQLFHLHNDVLARGGKILFTARAPSGQWGLSLPDLQSRMEATALARLLPPDDSLLAAVLVKQFADRQLTVAPGILDWVLRRMDRSFRTAHALAAEIDARALARGGKVTRALAQEVLDSLAGLGP